MPRREEKPEPKKTVCPPPKMHLRAAPGPQQLSRRCAVVSPAPPPGKPAPGGRGGGAAAQYRARLLAKQRAPQLPLNKVAASPLMKARVRPKASAITNQTLATLMEDLENMTTQTSARPPKIFVMSCGVS